MLVQVKFYLEYLGVDFFDYLVENVVYVWSFEIIVCVLEVWGCYQVVDCGYLFNFIFVLDDIVVVFG